MTPAFNARRAALSILLVGLFASLVMALAIDTTLAQGPFGAGAAGPPHPPSGIAGWVLAKQAEYYRALGTMIRAAKADGSAAVGLLGLSFAYGIFHAAGPGHGKAVISSYLVANEETWRRGVVLSFAAALIQALIAIIIVAIAAALIGATAKMMGDTVRVIETVSYLLIIALGARLLWVKGNGFAAALRETVTPPVALRAAGAAVALDASQFSPAHRHVDEGHHHHDPYDHADHDHAEAHHAHDGACDHAHGPEPQTLAGRGGWARGLSAIVAVGLRPCSGAILVLVFALAQGLFPLGVAATLVMGVGTAITVAAIATFAVCAKGIAQRVAGQRAGYGTLLMRGLECAAAAAVLGFGALLLAGYMASERMFAV
jgi:nickel/cobalt transporter (NicO) family protein